MSKEFEIPETVDVAAIYQQMSVMNDEIASLKGRLKERKQETIAVDEPTKAPEVDIWSDYKRPLIEKLKDTSRGGDFVYVGDADNRQKERAFDRSYRCLERWIRYPRNLGQRRIPLLPIPCFGILGQPIHQMAR
jgi:hypothetical protein